MPESHLPQVYSFESRRAAEMKSLIQKFGGASHVAPSMREAPLEENSEVLAFAERFLNGEIDVLVLMTGVGTRYLVDVIETKHSLAAFLDAMRKTTIAVRGPKPTTVLKEWDIPIAVRAPEPNTWEELLAAMEAELDLTGARIAVQEYGTSNEEFLTALRDRGANVEAVTIYRWLLPENCAPLKQAVKSISAGEAEVLLFTSAQQIRHVLQIAAQMNLQQDFLSSTETCLVASIGPTCTDALKECGLHVDFEASPPKMGHLVRGALEAMGKKL